MTERPRARKRSLAADTATIGRAADEIDIACCATIAYSSEDAAHPVENILDGQSGPGGTRWVSARPDTAEHIVVEFDQPRAISRLVYEVQETTRERTQEVRLEASDDGGLTYRQILVQEYNFSPGGKPPFSAKTNALIYGRLPISVSRLFQTRAAQARRLSRHSVSSLKALARLKTGKIAEPVTEDRGERPPARACVF